MKSLAILAACMMLPWALCTALAPSQVALGAEPAAARDRRTNRFRRHSLLAGAALVVASALAGACWVDPALSVRSPTAGAWFFSSLCAVAASASLALGRRTPEEAIAMPPLQMIGQTVQMAFVPILAVGLSLAVAQAVRRWLPAGPVTCALSSALLSVAAVLVVSPWLAMKLGIWQRLPRTIDAAGARWRLVHLPGPAPFFVHAAALPWLRAVLVSEGLFHSAPVDQWQALLQYEAGGASSRQPEHAMRWTLAIALCTAAFVIAFGIGARNGRELVAATVLAVCFTLATGWLANRQPASRLVLDASGPSMRELAQTLRSLPPSHRQALPRTSHRPVGSALYDRLFALGHDPGPRPQA
jgi:hypothetical protein